MAKADVINVTLSVLIISLVIAFYLIPLMLIWLVLYVRHSCCGAMSSLWASAGRLRRGDRHR
jgi:hypothetical protein